MQFYTHFFLRPFPQCFPANVDAAINSHGREKKKNAVFYCFTQREESHIYVGASSDALSSFKQSTLPAVTLLKVHSYLRRL